MMTKRKKIVICILCILFLFSIICTNLFHYPGEIEYLVNTVEKSFELGKVKYDNVEYYSADMPGPFGEGSSRLVLKVSSHCHEDLVEKFKHDKNIFTFPMEDSVSEFIYEVPEEDYLKKIDNGYYGVYNKTTKELVPLDELNRITKDFDLWSELHRYIFVQYDLDEALLYVFVDG